MNNIQRALKFAVKKHYGQTRKHSDLPYVTHVIEVMKTCSKITNNEDLICAAVLHDYIEDCDKDKSFLTKARIIRDKFNISIAKIVFECSCPPGVKKKEEYIWNFMPNGKKSDEAKLLKLVDRFHNVMDFAHEDEKCKGYSGKYALKALPLLMNFYNSSNDIINKMVKQITNEIEIYLNIDVDTFDLSKIDIEKAKELMQNSEVK